MPCLLFMSCEIIWTLISLPLQMAERLRRAQPVTVTNHVKARQWLIERAVTWLATESGWARRKRSAICSGKLFGCFIIFKQCCPCACIQFRMFIKEYLNVHKNFALIGRQWSLLSILVQTAWFYGERLQNDNALNFVRSFLDHSVFSFLFVFLVWHFCIYVIFVYFCFLFSLLIQLLAVKYVC